MAEEDDAQWKIAIFRDRLRHSLGARFFLRFHVGLILLFTILTGWLVDVLLLKAGLVKMPARYFVAILSAYGAFYLGVYFWIEYSGIKEYVKIRRAEILVGDDVPRKPVEIEEPWLDKISADPTLQAAGCLGGDGCMVIIVGFLVAIGTFYFFGGYVAANALTFFSDIVLELLLAAGLLRGLNRYESSGWMVSVWRHTRGSLAFTMFVAMLCGWYAQAEYPGVKTFPDVIQRWHR